MTKLKLNGLLLKCVHTLLVRHLRKKFPLKGRVLDVAFGIRCGGSHLNCQIRRGGCCCQNFLAAIQASLWSKNKGEGRPLLCMSASYIFMVYTTDVISLPQDKPGKYVRNRRGLINCIVSLWGGKMPNNISTLRERSGIRHT